ncbi:hypothetical protein CDAR_5771 [Caerostris darwini]|uniref:Uncharacterized protein n=1 Tax=Caerostris darwini TaxID=1538125 RepID=A0AAV4RHU9_9ARAC|nr:hypothetical protein CDAR_5771 [Caerostris darwini]
MAGHVSVTMENGGQVSATMEDLGHVSITLVDGGHGSVTMEDNLQIIQKMIIFFLRIHDVVTANAADMFTATAAVIRSSSPMFASAKNY